MGMRFDLTEQDSGALTTVLNTFLSILQQIEQGEANRFVLQRIEQSSELLVRLRENAPHLELTVRESSLLQELLKIVQGGLGQDSSAVRELQNHLHVISLPIDGEPGNAICLVVDGVLSMVQGVPDGAQGDLQVVQSAFEGVRSRLGEVELGEKDVQLLRGLLTTLSQGQGSSIPGLQRLEAALQSPKTQVSLEDRLLLGSVIELLHEQVQEARASGQGDDEALRNASRCLDEVHGAVVNLPLSGKEAFLLAGTIDFLDARMRSQAEQLQGLATKLGHLRQSLS